MKKNVSGILLIIAFLSCSNSTKNENLPDVNIDTNPKEISVSYEGGVAVVQVSCKAEWTAYSNEDWIGTEINLSSLVKQEGGKLKVSIKANGSFNERSGTVVVKSGSTRMNISVEQDGKPEVPTNPSINTPEGYQLVWQDEFNDDAFSMPDESLWWYEVWAPGTVNNELQRYVKGKQGDLVTAEVSKGLMKIHAIKTGNEVISARVNTKESWKYGYFEARLKLPKGKGTWPAFWMMPKQEGPWPDCGEIDIMEEVGFNPNYVSSSIHCKAYNHVIGTQKTNERLVPGAEDDFHVYALEWTEDYIRTFVDGKELFYFANDKRGDKNTWPFNVAFYLKLNLAWGGDWGGAQGVDEKVLPATYEIDYVRVFQKKN